MDTNQNSSGMMNGIPPVPRDDKKVGPIIGVLVIVLIIIVAALYFFSNRLNSVPTSEVSNTSNEFNSANAFSSTSEAQMNAELDAQMKDVDYSF